MLERSHFWVFCAALVASACVTAPPPPPPPPEPPRVEAPKGPTPEQITAAASEEAKALLAQAETDIQRARARRALWQQAWEDLVTAREASAAKDHARVARHARRASVLARLGLEQLTYPAVR